MTPGVSILKWEGGGKRASFVVLEGVPPARSRNARLSLELLHYVEEVVVDLRLVLELQLDLVEEVQRALELDPARRRRRHHVLHGNVSAMFFFNF